MNSKNSKTSDPHRILAKFAEKQNLQITGSKLYIPVVTLSTEDNTKLLKQLKSGFKKAINWNK